MEKIKKRGQDSHEVFNNETDDEAYERYKKRCYRHLVLKALLFFFFGILVRFVLNYF